MYTEIELHISPTKDTFPGKDIWIPESKAPKSLTEI